MSGADGLASITLELPAVREGDWCGVLVEGAELAGSPFWAVTIRGAFRPMRRSWFPDESAAVAYGATKAEEFGLPLLLLGSGGRDHD